MQSVPIHQAVGQVLAHDVTRIVPGQSKGPAFKKGHIIREEDIEVLLDIGKTRVYVLELSADQVHEDAAARRIAAASSGPGIMLSIPSEGRVNLIAEYTGLLKVDVPALNRLNAIPVLGLPGCVMYHRTSIFDLIVPRLLVGDRITREDIVVLGHGGFCAGCAECRYPVCSYGKV